MFNKSQDGFLWMESFTNFEKAPDLTKRGYRLDRMKLLLECFDNPQYCCKSIHIAGSKGKGSTGAFTASILKETGFKTGVYSSPHISDYRERITVDGQFANDDIYLKNMNLIKEMIEGEKYLSLPGGNEPTTFELLTLLAFLVFRDCECDWVVIETGLGGRLDATNLVNPEIVIITPVELEHTDLLGTTIKEIASEKAGIIKINKPVFSSRQTSDGEKVLREKTKELNGQFYYLPDLYDSLTTSPLKEGSTFEVVFRNGEKYKSLLRMYGDFQGENCTLAIAALNHLRIGLSKEIINNAISKTTLPGRMEIIGNDPIFMIDGAHTKISTQKLLSAFQSLYPKKGILIFGSVSGKDAEAMAKVLADHFQYIIISKPGTFKKSDPQGLFDLFIKKNKNTLLIPDPVEAERKARELSKGILPVLTTGSFYMAAEIRKILK
ncbi:MAG: bifunctional folylpolyglutamate synthase/dihydrofolate synthase [Deltaproteobacteria bacterium]|nr:bifunctional folylpolyglutamate synthase/dihydrofolate synthase [Deltaproteobacteria bacterium]